MSILRGAAERGGQLLEPETPRWSLDTIVKALGATSVAILGKETLRYWRAKRESELKHDQEFTSSLLVRIAQLEAKLDIVQNENMIAIKTLTALYDQRLAASQKEIDHLRALYFATYSELIKQGFRQSGFALPLLEKAQEG